MSATAHTNTNQVSKVELPNLNPKESNDSTISALANGKLPTNQQLNVSMEVSKDYIEDVKREGNLSMKGQLLANDVKGIIQTAQTFINEKNVNDKIQDIMTHSNEVSKELTRASSRLGVAAANFNLPSFLDSLTKYGMAKDTLSALNQGKNIVFYLIKSSEFKDYLMDMTEFMQTMASDSSDKLMRLKDTVVDDVKNLDPTLPSTTETTMEIASQLKDTIKDTASEWNAEKRKESFLKFRDILQKTAQSKETQQLVSVFWNWIDQLRNRVEEAKEKFVSKVGDRTENIREKAEESIDKLSAESLCILQDITDLINEFAGQGSFERFYNNSIDLWSEVVQDEEANNWFKSLQYFMEDVYQNPNPDYIDTKTQEGEELIQRGRDIMQGLKFNKRFNEMFNGFWSLLNKITHDETTTRLAQRVKQFGEHFALDSKGRPDLFVIQDSLVQLKNLVYPILKEKLGNLKIANIVGSTENMDYKFEDLVISIPELLPQSFDLSTKTDMKMDVEDASSKTCVKIKLDISKLKPTFQDIKFWYKRNSFPQIEDFGVADVDLSSGEGTRILVVWQIKAVHDRPFAFSLTNVNCTIDELDIKIKDAKHEILDNIAIALFIGQIKQAIAQSVVDGIVSVLQPLNDQINNWFVTQPLQKIEDQVNQKFQQEFSNANEALKETHPIKKMKEITNDLMEDAKVVYDNAKEVVIGQTANLREGVNDTIEVGKEIVKDVKKNAPSKKQIKKGGKKVVKKVGEAVESMNEGVDTAIEKAAEYGEKGTEMLEKGKKVAKKAVKEGTEVVSKGKRKVNEMMEEGIEKVEEMMDLEGGLKEGIEKGKAVVNQVLEEGVQKSTKKGVKKAKSIGNELLEQGKEKVKSTLGMKDEEEDPSVSRKRSLRSADKQKTSKSSKKQKVNWDSKWAI